jgi:hypothetical protein
MRKIVRAAVAIAAGAVTFSGVAAPPAQAEATVQGCAAGYVCIYPQNAGWNGGRPSLRFYQYGTYNLSGQFGIHRYFNNQVGTWAETAAYWCTGYNGGGTCGRVEKGQWEDLNLTPVNSVILCCRQS